MSSVPATQNYLDNLWASTPQDVCERIATMCRGDESRYVTVKFDPSVYERLEILAITDVQFGHKSCNVKRFIEYRDWILAEPYRFVLFLGDMVDAATLISIGSPYDNVEEPQGQVYRFAELAMPFRHRIIGYVGGNHERRSVKTFGDLGHLIAMLLKIPYSSGKQFIDIHYGEHKPFRSTLYHGRGASRTKGAKMQMLHQCMKQEDGSQMYWVGHLHDVLMTFDWRLLRKGGEIKLQKYAGAMSSSFLEYWGTYAEIVGLSPTDCMMARVILEPDGGWEITWR